VVISKGDEFIVFILHVYSNVLHPFQHVLKTNVECCVAVQCGLCPYSNPVWIVVGKGGFSFYKRRGGQTFSSGVQAAPLSFGMG
jgi:hypothetical protein